MKILLMPDGLNWIVDRNIEQLVLGIPEEFTVIPYTKISVEEFIRQANAHDLVHYGNWDIYNLKDALPHITTPILMSVRSHRYHPFTNEMYQRENTWFHLISPLLKQDFPNGRYIPNGIFDWFKPDHEFTVGFAGHPDYHTKEYKGNQMIKQACEELGCRFKPAFGEIKPEDMPEYYRSLDLYVCASEGEGFSTPVMECMAMNIPVLTTDVGLPSTLNVHKCERSVLGIKTGIEKFFTQKQVEPYTWKSVCQQMHDYYKEIYDNPK